MRVVFSFFFSSSSFLHLVLFLHLVKVCIVVLIVFSVCTFCTNGDNNDSSNNINNATSPKPNTYSHIKSQKHEIKNQTSHSLNIRQYVIHKVHSQSIKQFLTKRLKRILDLIHLKLLGSEFHILIPLYFRQR